MWTLAFDIVAASYREREKARGPLYHTLLAGVTMGGVAIFMSAVGITKMGDGTLHIMGALEGGAR